MPSAIVDPALGRIDLAQKASRAAAALASKAAGVIALRINRRDDWSRGWVRGLAPGRAGESGASEFGALGGLIAAALYRDASPLALGAIMSAAALTGAALYAFWLSGRIEV